MTGVAVPAGLRILTLDAALAQVSVAVFEAGQTLARTVVMVPRGQSANLAEMTEAALREAGGAAPGLVAVTVGPGSFTGLRTAISLAHGIALGAGCPLVGVSVAEALGRAATLGPDEALWVAIDSRRGRVFLHRSDAPEDGIRPFDLTALPAAPALVALAGDAASSVAEELEARGVPFRMTDARLPSPEAIAAVALERHAGRLPPCPAQPIYVEPAEAKLPAGGLRPPPA